MAALNLRMRDRASLLSQTWDIREISKEVHLDVPGFRVIVYDIFTSDTAAVRSARP